MKRTGQWRQWGGSRVFEPHLWGGTKQSDWPKWHEAIQAELQSLEANKTWLVVECPKDTNVVSSKWILHIKKNVASEIEKYKAWLVVRSFIQIHGINYYETYASVAWLASFCLILAMANRNGWPADSFDFDSAYLNLVLVGWSQSIRQTTHESRQQRKRKL